MTTDNVTVHEPATARRRGRCQRCFVLQQELDEVQAQTQVQAHYMRLVHVQRHQGRQIRLRVHENAEAYTVWAWLPGVHKGEIEVGLDGNGVRIVVGARFDHAQHVAPDVIERARHVGKRTRALSLPRTIDSAGARAPFQRGLFELTLPKAGLSPRLVPVA